MDYHIWYHIYRHHIDWYYRSVKGVDIIQQAIYRFGQTVLFFHPTYDYGMLAYICIQEQRKKKILQVHKQLNDRNLFEGSHGL
jgi:hypothetical protein